MSLQANFLEVPPIQKRKRIPMRVIQALVNHIAQNFNPEKVILFGSYAYGKPNEWSDVDILVVMDTLPEGEVAAAMTISNSLPLHWFSIDIVVRSQATIERRIPLGDWFLKEVMRQGKVLYERSS
jgi:uncharacterized protein